LADSFIIYVKHLYITSLTCYYIAACYFHFPEQV
jgi:hypothetical protein